MKRFLVLVLSALVLGGIASVPSPARAARTISPSGFTRETVAGGLIEPTAIAFKGTRILVTEKGGTIRIVRPDGKLRKKPLHSFSVSTEAERGLLGITLHPNFGENGFIYVYYTAGPGAKKYSGTPENRVSRLKKPKGGGGYKEKIILDHIPADGGHHNAGDIHFGFDGQLYIAVGDSGCCPNDAQGLDTLRGKILRINEDGSIPPDNPFVHTGGARPETYAFGLRNPWRIAERAVNHTFIVTDVGSETWEEVNSLQAGANYGWPAYEGPCAIPNVDCDPNTVNYGSTVKPIHWYNHNTGNEIGSVIAGGVFAEDSNYPDPYANAYFYGDTGGGWVHVLTMDYDNNVTARYDFDEVDSPVAFGQGPDGNIYVLSHSSGVIFKYTYAP